VNILLIAFLVEVDLDRALAGVYRVEGHYDTKELCIHAQDISGLLEVLQERVAPPVHIQAVFGVTTTYS
jgi:hypothetical protein